jgi:hypothetical protein
MIEKNMCGFDRGLRILIGLFLIFYFFKFTFGFVLWFGLFISFLLILTGITGFCGFYDIFGLSFYKYTKLPRITKKDLEEAVIKK